MAGKLYQRYRDQIIIALCTAFLLSIPTGAVKIRDAMAQTEENKQEIEQAHKEVKERTEKQRTIDREQNAKQAVADIERQAIKSDMGHIKETVDRIEKKLE